MLGPAHFLQLMNWFNQIINIPSNQYLIITDSLIFLKNEKIAKKED